ncbi:HNH endonuclease [Desulfovibrio mangrovi]|uniref:HNH endonuclease n=1 Tax=Desulfovibrio mangrovi TaxID=2976983 RepID=UPI002246B656|nr:HNH endonuclease [Desulfovibrio mangrovi]UZP68400.1 HNH endonuclease [Desulfovibrio mangrovi]
MTYSTTPLKRCFREPIPAVELAASLLNQAATAMLKGDHDTAQSLIRQADLPEVYAWLDSIWGARSPYVHKVIIPDSPPIIPKAQRPKYREANKQLKQALIERDGYHCRFCGTPVIRKEVRNKFRKMYPETVRWGKINVENHAAFQALWLQYDHILPHSRGGVTSLDNMVITCSACNYGRMESTLEEVGIEDPRNREPIRSDWDGLERIMSLP